MRYSTQGRILAELALVRICQLEDLDELADVIAQLQGTATAFAGGADASRVPCGNAGGRDVDPPAAGKKKS